ncbi:ABC transporter permease [Labrys monachus]|uniref:Peptide/nickel transport system permease protein n=1 Tax=Labrys monachus TaxID=217067 RepID=A0ABU0F7N0_9HYPH|nr:ABC transporter permease [Labrys monachus]MDQ0390613.1 peptide/nickel transport system permease protein [Labrys monachus]
MARLIAWRIFQGVVTLFAISVIIFLLTLALPGDAATAVLGQSATPATVAAYRHDVGLDLPPLTRYLSWLWNVLVHFDFGKSYTNQRVIVDDLWPRFKNTMWLASFATLLSVPLAIVTGVTCAITEGRLSDRAANIGALIAISMPEFFVGGVLILLFTGKGMWFPPTASNVTADMGFWARVFATFLPAVAMTCLVCAHMMRMTRNSVLSIMSTPYIEMAFLKGVKRSRVVARHALPNAASPIISVVALNIAYLVVGVVLVEKVFTYPGVGQYMIDAVSKRDIPVILACGLLFAAIFIILNTIADVLAIILNPRLRHPR